MKFMTFVLFLLVMTTSVESKTIPLADFAKKSEFKSFQISPDGKHVAYTYEDGNQVKLGTMNLKTKKGIHSFTVGDDREVVQFQWLNNKRLMFISQNITGWLDGADKEPELYFVNYDGKKRKLNKDFFFIISSMKNDDDHILIAKPSVFEGIKLHKYNINNMKSNYQGGEPKTVGTMKSRILSINVDHNEEPRIAYEFDPVEENDFDDDKLYLHIRKPDEEWRTLDVKSQLDTRPIFTDLGFNLKNDKFYFISNYDSPEKKINGLFEFDFTTDKIKLLFRHEDSDVLGGVYGAKDELIGVRYEAGYPDYFYLEDDAVASEVKFHKSLRASFSNADIRIGDYTKDEKTTTLRVFSDKNPGDFYTFNRETNQVNYVASSMPHINPKQMAKIEPFTLNARDGLKMYGQLTIPPGKEVKNLPMIIYPHGGPYGPRDSWQWRERPQLFASRGYLVLQLNFRGSGGYGMGFQEAGYTEWGAKMQDDITDATLWAIEQGYANKDRICLHGVSYGGYASMQAVVKEPDLYACSIPDAGPYELHYQWKNADSFKQNKKRRDWYLNRMIGSAGEERNKERSPVYHLDKLKTPLLIVHGSEDVRVPIGNAYILEEKLKEQGIKYETMYKKDGHGFQKVPYRIELYEKMLKFLDKHIGE